MPSKVEIDVVADVASANRKLDSLGRKMDDTGGKVEGFGRRAGTALKGFAVAAGAALAVDVGRELLMTAERIDLLDARIDTVFGDEAADVRSWAETVRREMGASATEVAGMAAATADLLKPMGATTEEAAELAIEIAELGNAHALWSPEIDSAAAATEILNKALLGERDGLIALGLKVSQAQVDAEKLRLEQEGVRFATDELATAQATLNIIMGQSEDALSFAGSEASETARKINGLKSDFETLKEELARELLPVLQGAVLTLDSIVTNISLISGAVESALGPLRQLKSAIEDIPGLPDLNLSLDQFIPGKQQLDLIERTPLGRILPGGDDDPSGLADFVESNIGEGSSSRAPGLTRTLQAQAPRELNVTVNVPPTADMAEIGRQIVDAIEAYERANGTAWRD